MNKKLRFSWGHIVAFLALIFIAYVVFMGTTYYTVGNYCVGLITMGCCVLLIALTILGAQVLKGVDKKFHRSIVLERILVVCSPIIIIIVGFPFSHFWTVHSSEDKIIQQFDKSIKVSMGIFSDYESYSDYRVKRLESSLKSKIKDDQLISNRKDELSLYLKSSTNKSIDEAKKWINKVSNSPSIWNVFLFGNISSIEGAIIQWTESLNAISTKRISSETDVSPFSAENKHKKEALNGLEEVKKLYKEIKVPNALAITSLLICYLMLLCPYFIQERHSRNIEKFFGNKNKLNQIIKTGEKTEINKSKYDTF